LLDDVVKELRALPARFDTGCVTRLAAVEQVVERPAVEGHAVLPASAQVVFDHQSQVGEFRCQCRGHGQQILVRSKHQGDVDRIRECLIPHHQPAQQVDVPGNQVN